jgi:2-polyprenyl-3-methyl-5-hydroxy-6-metoxy-1,4-benzoquinol methylase
MTLFASLFADRCRLCGARAATTIGSVGPTHPGNFATNDYTLRQCGRCEVVYLHPLPSASDLKVLYEDSVQFSSDHYTDPEQVNKILDYYGSELDSLQLLPKGSCRLLEVGAGLAWVSRAAKLRDGAVHTVAQDVSAECAEACPWVDRYFVGSLEQLDDREPYHLVSLTHVIEHLADPAAVISQIARLLAPGGNVFMTAPFRPIGWTPSGDINAWREYSYLHVPAHITYFSRRWFEDQARALRLEMTHWNAEHEQGQAFALVLRKLG